MSTATNDTIARPPEPVTVVVAIGPAARREQVVRWLQADGRFDVIGQPDQAGVAVEAIVAGAPDLAFVDIDLPSDPASGPTDGIAAMAEVSERRPSVRMIAVSDADDDRAYTAVAAGAVGCYVWDDPVASAAELAAGVARGEGALTPGWAGRILDEVRWLTREPGAVPAPELSPTELEVLKRTASGARTPAIAQLHSVTEHLVNLHAAIVITKVWRHHDDLRRLAAAGRASPATMAGSAPRSASAGYSGTPLAKKLGLASGQVVALLGAPDGFEDLLDGLPDDVTFRRRAQGRLDVAITFQTERAVLERRLPAILRSLERAGAIWVAWPKKAAKVPTDITEDTVREVVLPMGLVDVKVCAIDDTWSGLKVVWRRENR